MKELLIDFISPFKNNGESFLLRLVRIFYRFSFLFIFFSILYSLQQRHFNFFSMNDTPILNGAIIFLALATLLNLGSGLRDGILISMYSSVYREKADRSKNRANFYILFFVYTVAFLGECILLYYLFI